MPLLAWPSSRIKARYAQPCGRAVRVWHERSGQAARFYWKYDRNTEPVDQQRHHRRFDQSYCDEYCHDDRTHHDHLHRCIAIGWRYGAHLWSNGRRFHQDHWRRQHAGWQVIDTTPLKISFAIPVGRARARRGLGRGGRPFVLS